MAADQILSNTGYNRETFVNGDWSLRKKRLNYVPGDVVDVLQEKSSVLPVPLPEEVFPEGQPAREKVLEVLFNHLTAGSMARLLNGCFQP